MIEWNSAINADNVLKYEWCITPASLSLFTHHGDESYIHTIFYKHTAMHTLKKNNIMAINLLTT